MVNIAATQLINVAFYSTKYLNNIFTINRQMLNPTTSLADLPADYSELGNLLITVAILGFLLPPITIWLIKFRPATPLYEGLLVSRNQRN